MTLFALAGCSWPPCWCWDMDGNATAHACQRRAVQQSIETTCLPGPQQQTRRTLLQPAIDQRWQWVTRVTGHGSIDWSVTWVTGLKVWPTVISADRQTDGRTDRRTQNSFVDPASHYTMRLVWIIILAYCLYTLPITTCVVQAEQSVTVKQNQRMR